MRTIPREFLRQITRAEWHVGGLKCQTLFALPPDFLRRLAEECVRLAPLGQDCRDHAGAYTQPYGSVRQFSLYNRSGDLSDRSHDYDPDPTGKKFAFANTAPALAAFIASLPGLLNVRLNCLGPGAGLSPHEESIWFSHGGQRYLRLRFHLPLLTNSASWVQLDGESFCFRAGSLYFFHQGCLHAVGNDGDSDRYHLVWDALLSQSVWDEMFGGGWAAQGMGAIPKSGAVDFFTGAVPVRAGFRSARSKVWARAVSHPLLGGLSRRLWRAHNQFRCALQLPLLNSVALASFSVGSK